MSVDSAKVQQDIIKTMKNWQKVEDAAVLSTAQIINRTKNPLIRLVAETIQKDSARHRRIQEFIIDSLEFKAISLTPDELVDVWNLVEQHIMIEQKTIDLAQQMLDATKNQQGMIVQNYLIQYLLQDEQKHNDMLSRLDDIKKGIYRSV